MIMKLHSTKKIDGSQASSVKAFNLKLTQFQQGMII